MGLPLKISPSPSGRASTLPIFVISRTIVSLRPRLARAWLPVKPMALVIWMIDPSRKVICPVPVRPNPELATSRPSGRTSTSPFAPVVLLIFSVPPAPTVTLATWPLVLLPKAVAVDKVR